jgi:3-deoxy-D-manno-octulosonate 8-phosphate phosphatase (KDO 8-P phosphatase)
MSKKRAKKIKLFLFDVDGVLTDGKLFFLPVLSPAGQLVRSPGAKHGTKENGAKEGEVDFGLETHTAIECKGFHAHDGVAISLARLAGLKTGLITKRVSETVAIRARDLRLDYVHQGIQDKLMVFRTILKQAGVRASEVAYVGDDVVDLPLLRHCGLAIAVANARHEVKREAHWVTPHNGGDGALRDALEYILKAQGTWKQVLRQYIGEQSPQADSKRKRGTRPAA